MSEMGKLAEKLKRGRRKARKAEREGKAEPRSQVGKALQICGDILYRLAISCTPLNIQFITSCVVPIFRVGTFVTNIFLLMS